jgi:hypothetical protein
VRGGLDGLLAGDHLRHAPELGVSRDGREPRIAPRPSVKRQVPVRPVGRPQVAAIKPAACSCRVRISGMQPERVSESTKACSLRRGSRRCTRRLPLPAP